jgi:hypothetical protein
MKISVKNKNPKPYSRAAARLTASLLALSFMLTAALYAAAADEPDGAYTTATNTYYLNPDTGVTDDGGTKNAALGEGMCRSVVYDTALVELTGGKIYLTVRLQLMSNMKDFRLFVQDEPKGGYTKVTPRVMAEDAGADTADYRFEIPSVTAYMSWEMYVIPMGRDVKFYMNVSDTLSPGSGDFIVSVKPTASPEPATPAPIEITAPTAEATSTPSPAEVTVAPSVVPGEVTSEPSEIPAVISTPEVMAVVSEVPALAVSPEASSDTPASPSGAAASPEQSSPQETPAETPAEASPTEIITQPDNSPDVPEDEVPAEDEDGGTVLLTVGAVGIVVVAAAAAVFIKSRKRTGK